MKYRFQKIVEGNFQNNILDLLSLDCGPLEDGLSDILEGEVESRDPLATLREIVRLSPIPIFAAGLFNNNLYSVKISLITWKKNWLGIRL